MRSRRVFAAVTVALVSLALGACSDDGDDEASIAEYCEFSNSLNEVDGDPSDEQLDQIVDLAPGEIEDDVEALVQAFRDDTLDDPDVNEAAQNVAEWEDEHCGEVELEEPTDSTALDEE